MATQQFPITLAAGAVNVNIIAGTMFELVGQRPRAVQIYAVQDPTANVTFEVRVTHDRVVEVEDGTRIQIASAANLGPLKSDHELVQFMARPGERIVIAARNSGSASGTARFLVVHQDF